MSQSGSRCVGNSEASSTILHSGDSLPSSISGSSFEQTISTHDIAFSAALMKLLDQINELNRETSEHNRLFNLLYRYVEESRSTDEKIAS